jgi:hypothetical protein
MRKLLAIFILLFIVSNNAQAGYFSYQALKNQFGFYFDTLSNASQESLMLRKADSLFFAQSGEKFDSFPKVRDKGSFNQFPCVTFYHLGTNSDIIGPEDPHKLILFNYCDSAIYNYGGDIKDYNSVFKKYLIPNIEFENVMKIIDLFLTTQYAVGSPRILRAPKEFDAVYDSLFPDVTILSDSALFRIIAEDKRKVSKAIKPLKYLREKGFQYIDFYAIGGPCKVEHWIIRVFPGTLRLDKREIIFKRLAACGFIE